MFCSAQEEPFHNSVSFATPGLSPPNIKVAGWVPLPPAAFLPVLRSVVSVQEDPFHDSTTAWTPGDALPALPKQAVLSAPVPTIFSLAVFRSLTSVHELPFHDSVTFR